MAGAIAAVTVCVAAGTRAASYNYAEALQKSVYFYECQQSGTLPAWNRVGWRGNSCLSDGADAGHDLTGGWFDAGDHVKFNFPLAYTVTVLSWGAIEFKQGFVKSGQLKALRNNIRFAADYLLKCHTADNELYGQVGKGGDDHAFWGPAESVEYRMQRPAYRIDRNNPGSDLAGETAAALAAASMVLKDADASYAATLIAHARQLYAFADTYRGKYTESIADAQGYYNSWSGYNDELVWGALWLFRATGEAAYLDKAKLHYDSLSNEPQTSTKSFRWTLAWDDKSYGCYVLMAELAGDTRFHDDARRWLDYWTTGYNGQTITYTPGGLAWLDQWGSNRYAANTAFCALVYAKYCGDAALSKRYHDFAVSQISYMLGDNPNSRSMVVGFGVDPPQRPHHRTCHGYYPSQPGDTRPSRHVLYGALVGGPDQSDTYDDNRNNYVNNEVACDYNGCFTGALAALTDEFGGEALAEFPPAVQREVEFYVEASINVDGDRFTEIRAVLMNVSAWPARGAEHLSFRYFMDLSEAVNGGVDISEITVTRNYAQGSPAISGLVPYGEGEHIYSVEVSYEGDTLYPGTNESYKREAQFRISLPQSADTSAWDPSNDWSCKDLEVGYSGQKRATNIAVYDNGVQISGAEPNKPPVLDLRERLVVRDASGRYGSGEMPPAVFNLLGRSVTVPARGRTVAAAPGLYVESLRQGEVRGTLRVW